MDNKLEFVTLILVIILPIILGDSQNVKFESTSKPALKTKSQSTSKPAKQTAVSSEQGSNFFDIRKYGAKPDADVSKIVTDIWKEAIASVKPSKIFIPPGKWKCLQLVLLGNNKAPIEIELAGTLRAGRNLNDRPDPSREWITINYVTNLTIYGGGVFDGEGEIAWTQNDCHKNKNCVKLPYNLSFNFLNNTIIRDVTTRDSKNFHTNLMSSYNITFQRFTIYAPGDSPNTDGLHVARSTGVRIIDSIIKTGDDCISMGDELHDVLIQNITCGPGHGISIGSLGKNINEKDISDITIRNCTFKGTSNGVRIKTWPSAPATLTISGLTFEDIIVKNASNPIIIDQQYCPWNLCSLKKPSLIQIKDVMVRNVRGTTDSPEPIILSCSSGKPCKNVTIGDVDVKFVGISVGNIKSKCANVKPKLIGKHNVKICSSEDLFI